MYGWINIFGESEISVRIPSLLFGYASIIIFCLWTRRRLGPDVALGVLIWVLISPFHIWYSTEAKNNAMVMFFTVIIFVSYANLFESGEKKWISAAIISGALGIFTDFLVLIPLASVLIMGIISLTSEYSGERLKTILKPFFITALIVSPLLFFKLYHSQEILRDYLKPFTIQELFLLLGNFLPSGNAISDVHAYRGLASLDGTFQWTFLLFSGIIFIIILIKGIYAFAKSTRGYFINLAFMVPILMMFCMSWYMAARYKGGHHLYLERVLTSVLIYFYALILIRGATSIRSFSIRCVLLSLIFSITLAGSLSMLTIKKDKWTIWLPNPDWRAFSSEIKDEFGRAIVFTSTPPLELRYYLEDKGEMALPLAVKTTASPNKVKAYIKEQFHERSVMTPEFFYVAINRYWDIYGTGYINEKIIMPLYPLLEERHYLALDVYRYAML